MLKDIAQSWHRLNIHQDRSGLKELGSHIEAYDGSATEHLVTKLYLLTESITVAYTISKVNGMLFKSFEGKNVVMESDIQCTLILY